MQGQKKQKKIRTIMQNGSTYLEGGRHPSPPFSSQRCADFETQLSPPA